MTLIEIVQELATFDSESTIYASKPWTSESRAIVAKEPDSGGCLKEARTQNLEYFIEVFVAIDFLGGWQSNLDTAPTVEQKCSRLIEYAINDA